MFVQIFKSELEQRYEVKTKPNQKITELNVSDTFHYFYFYHPSSMWIVA